MIVKFFTNRNRLVENLQVGEDNWGKIGIVGDLFRIERIKAIHTSKEHHAVTPFTQSKVKFIALNAVSGIKIFENSSPGIES